MTQQGMADRNHPRDEGRMVEIAKLGMERPDPVVALVEDQPQGSPGEEFPDQNSQNHTPKGGVPVDQGEWLAAIGPKTTNGGWMIHLFHEARGWILALFRSKRIKPKGASFS